MPSIIVMYSTRDKNVVEQRLAPILRNAATTVKYCPVESYNGGTISEANWYVVVLSANLNGPCRPINRIMESFPNRVIPVTLGNCYPATVHPRFDFLNPIDFSSDPAIERLSHEWKRNGLDRQHASLNIFMFLSLKGGVAKTTNAVAVAECLADAGNRVLLIDTDHQCGASALLLDDERVLELEERKKTLADLFHTMLSDDFVPQNLNRFIIRNASNIGQGMPNLSVITCSLRIEDFWFNLSKARREQKAPDDWRRFLFNTQAKKVKAWLAREFDYVLIDCPPSVCWQVRFFLKIAHAFIVPTIPDRLSVRGAEYLMTRIHNLGLKKIQPMGTLWSIYRSENSVHRDTIAKRDVQPGTIPQPFETVIPNATAITRSTLEERFPASFSAKYERNFAKIYRQLCSEITSRAYDFAQEKEPVVQEVV